MSLRPLIPRADPAVKAPSWPVRPGGWDCHAHVFGPALSFPFRADAAYRSPDQLASDYVNMLDALALGFGVLVQPSVYGHDNSAMIAAMSERPGRLFGIVDLDIFAQSDAQIAAMTAAGILGLRLRPAAGTPEQLRRVADRLREIGWHLDLYCETTAVVRTFAPVLRTLAVPLMIEAMGEPRAGEPVSGDDFAALLALLRDGQCWVKLSHPYHIDPGAPPYAAAAPFAQAILAAAPGRAVWGSDWPHPMKGGPMPNDGLLLDLLLDWAGCDVELANRVLIENPARFYAQ